MHRKTLTRVSLAICCLGLLVVSSDGVQAADHNEAPGTMVDHAADLADFYAWHTDTTLVAAVTFAGLSLGGEPATYDPDVKYSIHIDHDGDNTSDIDIECCFGESAGGSWYVNCENVPGVDGGRVWGPVDTTIDADGTLVFAGSREDPFFMDFDGFVDTLATDMVSFNPMNDTFAGTNVTAIVLEMDRDAAANGGTTLQAWATTERRDNP